MSLSPADYYAANQHQVRYQRAIDGPFEHGVSRGQLRQIAKCEQLGFEFERVYVPEACHEIITQNRRRKGREYALTLTDWERLFQMPDTAYCFTVTPEPIAAAMCVRVAPRVLYVSAWGDVDVPSLSPVAFLARELYRWCAGNGFGLLDIGIADEPSLAAFKMRLGFRPSRA